MLRLVDLGADAGRVCGAGLEGALVARGGEWNDEVILVAGGSFGGGSCCMSQPVGTCAYSAAWVRAAG